MEILPPGEFLPGGTRLSIIVNTTNWTSSLGEKYREQKNTINRWYSGLQLLNPDQKRLYRTTTNYLADKLQRRITLKHEGHRLRSALIYYPAAVQTVWPPV